MSIEITLKFETIGTAQAALARLREEPKTTYEHAPELTPKLETYPSRHGAQQAASTNDTGAVAQPAPTGAATSLDDVNNAFRGYLAKGQGRTAATGMAILKEHGLASVKQARAEQYGVLKAAFEAAGPENPLGKVA